MLYSWAEAMALSSAYNSAIWGGNSTAYQGICPSGWHLPTDAEWLTLESISTASATDLKASSGWGTGNGKDTYGFRILPAGGSNSSGNFAQGSYAYFWSATEDGYNKAVNALGPWLGASDATITDGASTWGTKATRQSVRCVAN